MAESLFNFGVSDWGLITQRGTLPHERGGNSRQKIGIKPQNKTNLGMAQALFDP